MVLHLKEYAEHDKNKAGILNHYDKLSDYLHEMDIEDIVTEIKRHRTRSEYIQQLAISDYFIWLSENYGIDLVEKNYALRKFIIKSKNDYQGIINIEQLKKSIEENLVIAESGNTNKLPDFSGIKAIFFLEWLGVLPKSAITIKLTDVSDDGRQIFIPAENRCITVDDDDIARYFVEYKQKTGFMRSPKYKKETLYYQDTFYRNTRNSVINEKSIYNARQAFISACDDKRFSGTKIYYSGRYYQMFKAECSYNDEFSASDKGSREIINKIFNENFSYSQTTSIIRDYMKYKETYLRTM